MNWNDLWLRAKALLFNRRAESDLQEELESHLEMQTVKGIRSGMSHEDAKRAALAAFGGASQVAEQCRDERGTRWIEDFAKDLHYALRQSLQHRSFFIVAAATLAIAIGATTAIFSVVYGVLLRPFPYSQPDRLAAIWCTDPARGVPRMGCAAPDLREITARNASFEALAGYYVRDTNITDGTPERILGVRASGSLFPLLGVDAALGRTFSSSEETFGQHRVVVLSDAIWKRRFGARTDIAGTTVRLNGELYTIIGVMRPDFQFPSHNVQMWMPMSFADKDAMGTRGNHFIDAIARLKANADIGQARASLQSIARQLQGEFAENSGLGADVSDYVTSVIGEVRSVLFVLLGAAGIVLLIACVNVANLLLSRASARRREISVRSALGASRGRLVRQLLTESTLLGGVGAGVGVALSFWLVHLIRTLGPTNIPRLRGIEVDGAVLVFTALVTLLSVVLFGLAPALDLARVRTGEALKEGGRSLTAGSRTNRSRDVLVVAEITLSLVLVIGAGLFLQTLVRLQQVDPGFRPENVLTMSVSLPQAKYPDAEPIKAARFYEELTKKVAQIPGVKAVGASTALPIANWGGWGKYFTVDEHPASRLADVPNIHYRQVTPDYVRALGIGVIEGRFFNDDDTAERPRVAVINESARRRYFPNVSPIGKLVYPGPPEATVRHLLPSPDFRIPRFTVIGVIADVKHSGLRRAAEPELFVSHPQGAAKDNEPPSTKMFLMIKTDNDPLRLASAVRAAVQSLDPEQPVADVASMEQRMETHLATQRFQLFLFGSFAVIALVLAGVGVYGVMSYSVRLRMQEIGVRMALGATGGDVLRIVVRHGLWLGAIGVITGTVLGLGTSRFLSTLLFGVRANDSVTFFAAACVLIAVVFVATVVPSARAARTDPLTVLRTE